MPNTFGCESVSTLNGPLNDNEGTVPSTGGDVNGLFASNWYVFRDVNHTGTITPAAMKDGITSDHGGHAFAFAGRDLHQDFWGAGLGMYVEPCVEAGSKTGVQFWLKNDRPVDVSITTLETTSISDGGTCTNSCSANKTSFPVPVSSGGTTVQLAFASFSGGSAALNKSAITGLVFTVNKPNNSAWAFTVAVDDIGFY